MNDRSYIKRGTPSARPIRSSPHSVRKRISSSTSSRSSPRNRSQTAPHVRAGGPPALVDVHRARVEHERRERPAVTLEQAEEAEYEVRVRGWGMKLMAYKQGRLKTTYGSTELVGSYYIYITHREVNN